MYHITWSLIVLSSFVVTLTQAKEIYSGNPFCHWPSQPYEGGPAAWRDRCGAGFSNWLVTVQGLQCSCNGGELQCPGNADGQPSDVEYCKMYCTCDKPKQGEALNTQHQPENNVATNQPVQSPPDTQPSPWDTVETCSGSCEQLDSCPKGCACKANSIFSFFWFSGSCASVELPVFAGVTHDGLRRKKDRRQIVPVNQTVTNQAVSGIKEAVPCNASYVSLGCATAKDGIVHEPIENWLGKLLPNGTDPKTAPIDPEWLSAHNQVVSDPNMVS